MLNSILKFAIFIVIVAAITYGIHLLIVTPGQVEVMFGGYEASFTPLSFVFIILGFFFLLWFAAKVLGFVLAFIRFLAGDETAFTRYFERNRERKGLEALARGMAALSASDARKAKAQAQRAERYLRRPELTRLLSAQAHELAGDMPRAKYYYKALADDPHSAFVGISGLLRIAMSEKDTETALILARTAAALKSDDRTALETLYTLQTQKFDWEGARTTLAAQKRAGHLSEEEAQRRDSMLALAQAEDAEEAGRGGEALKFAVEAAKVYPGNPEAVDKAARMLNAEGASKQAVRIIADAWKVAPSPKIAAAFAALEQEEGSEARRRRFEQLFKANPDHQESHLTAAELALTAQDWAAARESMGHIREDQPSARSCAIMAAICRGEGRPEAEVRGWLARALSAPRDPHGDGMVADAVLLPLITGGTEEERAEKAVTAETARETQAAAGEREERADSGNLQHAVH